jgi:hypothetical protein
MATTTTDPWSDDQMKGVKVASPGGNDTALDAEITIGWTVAA